MDGTMTELQQRELQDSIARSRDFSHDPEAQRIVREAEQSWRDEAARRFLRDEELFQMLGLRDIDDMDAHLSELCQAGFPFAMNGTSHIQRVLERDVTGKARPSVVAERFAIENWLAAFDATARRLGYTKAAEPSSSPRSRLARVAAGAGALLIALLQF
jgi:hypothetical protein